MAVELKSSSQKTVKPIQLSYDEILEILPQRPPFIFVDHVNELVEGKRVIAEKKFSLSELNQFSTFGDNHKGFSFVSETLISESIGQVGIIFFKASIGRLKENLKILLTRIEITFKKQTRLGTQLLIEVAPVKITEEASILYARGFLARETIVEGEMSLFARPRTK